MKTKKKIILFFILFSGSCLFAHPHLFIKPSIKVVTDNNIIKGLQISWEWDKWWSQDVLDSCDKNKNGKIDSNDEQQLVYKDFFIGIKDFNYFTMIYADNKKINIKNILNFKVEVKNCIVTYIFFVPFDINITANKVNFKIIFNDETIYTAFDEKIYIIDNNSINYTNIKIEPFSYYGRQIIFDYTF